MIYRVNGFQISLAYNLHREEYYNIDYLDEESHKKVVRNWMIPEYLHNLFINYDIETNNIDVWKKIIKLIEYNRCKHLIIKLDSIEKKDLLLDVINRIDTLEINTVQLFANYKEFLFSESFGDFIYNSVNFSTFVIYNAPFNKNFSDKIYYFSGNIKNGFLKTKLLFKTNYELFSESQAHHTYFNRKLYIGPNGEIKNAPECPETFGYIQDLESPEELKAIVQTPEFQKYWFVHKEITDVCKDCEFRHMCVDNRLPFQRAENEWYHQTECNYNPYIAKWQGEEGYRTLEECGVISNENGFSIDHEKIAEINKELWGED